MYLRPEMIKHTYTYLHIINIVYRVIWKSVGENFVLPPVS